VHLLCSQILAGLRRQALLALDGGFPIN